MKLKIRNLFCLLMFFSLTAILSVPLFALPDSPPVNEQGNPGSGNLDNFSEADAIRYGGIFGPLSLPDLGLDIFTSEDPTSPFRASGISTRDIGFGSDEPHYLPITPAREVSSSP